jgi:hypothetical protein
VVKAIAFIDDIIVTGQSVEKGLRKLNEQCGEILRQKGILIVIGAICGFSRGLNKIEQISDELDLKVKYQICDPLNEEDQCFSESSKMFTSKEEREQAKSIALEQGNKLDKKQPLGYEDSQLAVVFCDNCPNNTLPIIWAESSKESSKWTPLFKRNKTG